MRGPFPPLGRRAFDPASGGAGMTGVRCSAWRSGECVALAALT